jgi:hypothetical protein
MALTRSRRDRQPPDHFTPSRQERPYELKKKEALLKKIDATNREVDVDIELKQGTLVLEFSAAAYEVFRKAIIYYYDNSTSKVYAITQSQDKGKTAKNVVVDESMSVKFFQTSQQLYRVNLHHTTSRVTVNGRGLDEFMNTDLSAILTHLDNQVNYRELNSKIRQACNLVLGDQSPTNQTPLLPATNGETPHNSITPTERSDTGLVPKSIQFDHHDTVSESSSQPSDTWTAIKSPQSTQLSGI